MKTLVATIVSLMLVPQVGMACPENATALGQQIKSNMTAPENAQAVQFAQYLNDDFYHDLACRMLRGGDIQSAEDITPETMDTAISGLLAQRNQYDALMLILEAMQGADEKD